MDLGIKDKMAIVCASSKGLGLSVVESLLDEGCNAVVSSSKEVNIKNVSDYSFKKLFWRFFYVCLRFVKRGRCT